ncbi:MMPL family transporter [Paenibacillus sp. SAF-054]|uniref:MMPL family transporter n=1 Tax=unclassified Paenibacillus TaxID=185978 RepID=UPI003F7E77DC
MGYRLLAFWINRHPGVIVACWTAFFIIFGSFSSGLPSIVSGPGLKPEGSSIVVQQLLEERAGIPEEPIWVVFERNDATSGNEFDKVISDTLKRMSDVKGLQFVLSPLKHPNLKSANAAYAVVEVEQSSEGQASAIRHIRSLLPVSPSVSIQLTGKGIVQEDVNRASMQDFKRVERIGIPVAFLILWIAFGGILYALIPVLTGLVTVSASMGIMAVIGRAYELELSNFILNVIPMTGLALSLDFAFILTSRFKEEIKQGHADTAVRTTLLTSGRAVFYSAACVICGLVAVAFIPMPMFVTSALSSIVVVSLATVVSLSLVPAILRLTAPWLQAKERKSLYPTSSYLLWSTWAERVIRRPFRMFMAAVVWLLAMLIPAFGLATSVPDAGSLPIGYESRQADETLKTHFRQKGTSDIWLVIRSVNDSFSEGERTKIYTWLSELKSEPLVLSVKTPFMPERARKQGEADDMAVFTVTLNGPLESEEVDEWLRSTEKAAGRTGLDVLLGGEAKFRQEIKDSVANALPEMIIFIVLTNFVVLLIAFRSILIPIKAIIMNLLSITASFGVLVLVFQTGIFGMEPGRIAVMIPVFVFGLVFGVSMDYGVFLLSRMSEAYEESGNPETAIREGMASTGKLISSAAAIMIAVTLPFAFGEVEGVRQLGVGIAAAVFIDATLIRLLLVPSLMKLLGRYNWWGPRWLRSSR